MKFSAGAVGVLAVLWSQTANAAVFFDSLNVTDPTYAYDGLYDNFIAMADSFTVAAPTFSAISLELSLSGPAVQGGQALVYLVPDDGSANSVGNAGLPTATFDNGGNFTGFTGTALLGAVSDSSISSTGSIVTFSVAPGAVPASTSQEYWVALVPTDGSSIVWDYSSATDGTGWAGQASFAANAASNGGGYNISPDGSPAPYDLLVVEAPEPASLALLSGGLVLFGYVRRRPA